MKIAVNARNYNIDCDGLNSLKEKGFEIIDNVSLDFASATKEEKVIEAVGDADIVIAGMEPYNAKVFDSCKNLKLISRRGVGFDAIDTEECKKRNIAVLRTVGAVEGAVAEHVMAYILYFARNLNFENSEMQQGRWTRIKSMGAKNHTLGLVGFGGIGKEIAKRAVPFGMKVIYYARHPQEEWKQEFNVKYMPLDELLAESDFVSVNVPLNESTRNMFNKDLFEKMKKGSILINIARGAIVNEADLREAILSGHIGGAAVDAFNGEPCTDSLLKGLENVVLTPHTAAFTEETFNEMNNVAAYNVKDFLDGILAEKYRLV